VAKLSGKPEQFKRADVLRVRRRVVLSSNRGQVYIRKWPKQRGRAASQLQQAWIDDFSMKARLLKSVNPQLLVQAQNYAKGTGWYYRDVLERAAAGKLIIEQEEHKITTPSCSFFSPNKTAVVQNVETYIATQASYWDNNSFRDAAFPTRMVFKAPGLYLIGAEFVWNPSAGTSMMFHRIWANRTYILAGQSRPGIAINDQSETLVGVWYFHANEYAECSVLKNNAGNQVWLRNFWAVGITPESLIP